MSFHFYCVVSFLYDMYIAHILHDYICTVIFLGTVMAVIVW